MRKYRAGVIGCGRIGSTIDDEIGKWRGFLMPYSHTACYMEVEEVEIACGADADPKKLEAYGERWGVRNLYEDYREMLEKENLDIVSVTTRTDVRARIVIECAQAGVKAIFAEKPIAVSLKEADDMVSVCEENGVVLAVGCTRRWHPFYNRAREILDEGLIGKLIHISAYLHCGISHNGSHLIDIVRYFAHSEVESVYGEMESDEKARTDEDLSGNGYLKFANGVRAFLRMMPCGGIGVELDLICESGRIRALNNGEEFELWKEVDGELVRATFPRPQRIESAGVRAVRDIIGCIETGRQARCSGRDGRSALEVAIALRESHRRGGVEVNLPLRDRSLRILPHA